MERTPISTGARVAGACAAVLVLALAVSGCGGSGGGHAASSTGRVKAKPHLVDLDSVAQLRSLFNADAGEPRLVVIASPT